MKKFKNYQLPAFLTSLFVQGTFINAEGEWEAQQARIAKATNQAFPIIQNNGVELSEEQIDRLFHCTKTITREVIDTNGVKTKVTSVKRDGLLENAGIFGFSGNSGIVYTDSRAFAFHRNHNDQVYKAWFRPS